MNSIALGNGYCLQRQKELIIMNNEFYRDLIFSKQETCKNIMKKIDIPSSVFKYRCFYRNTKNGLEEEPYWRESMEGKVFCSLAKEFNRNDSDDCDLKYNKRKIRDTICNQFENKGKTNHQINKLIDDTMEKYIYSIRDNFRIGCFTTSLPEERYMWGDANFGGDHTGYCIEYSTYENIMFPGSIIFLPILYDKQRYDSTNVICNLIKNGGKVNALDVISLAYNFALIKPEKYIQEKEWRIIITCNRYSEYFNVDRKSKVDFSNIIKGIYLGKNYKKYDLDGEKYKYALNICKLRNVPLFEMADVNGELIKKCVYTPIAVLKT